MLPRLISLLVLLFASALPVLAQEQPDPVGELADQAVQEWVNQPAFTLERLTGLSTIEVCELLPAALVNPPPAEGTRVNVNDRIELPTSDPDVRLFSYSAAGAAGQLHVVQATMVRTGDSWSVQQVGFRQPPPSGLRAWVQTPPASWVFGALSLMVVVLLLRPSPLRRWLGMALGVIRQHRRLYVFSMALLFGVFAFGAYTGSQLPDECTAAVFEAVAGAVSLVGATQAYDSGSVARAAVVTFHQNFVVVTLSVLFSLAMVFGVPAYLFGMISFFTQAIPFGMVGGLVGIELLFMVLLLLLELTAYFTVVAGGGFLLATLIRQGFSSFPQAVGKLLLMLPVAMVLLLAGAWYEALILVSW